MTATPYRSGQLLIINLPQTDGSPGKLRPAMVISNHEFNGGEDITIVPLSGQLSESDRFAYPILKSYPYFTQTKLKFESAVKWSKPQTVTKDLVIRRLGTVPPEILAEIIAKVKSIFS